MYTKYLQLVREVVASLPGVDEAIERRLATWIADVEGWNRRVDLTAARGDRELVDLLLADAALLGSRIAAGSAVVDVGSGAGAPGLALAGLRPDLRVTLVEPMQKRAALLRITAGQWQRSGGAVRIEQSSGEKLAERGANFEVALSRATLPPPEWLALGARLAPAGQVWVLLARDPAPELAGWRLDEDVAYRWPLTGAERRAVRYARG